MIKIIFYPTAILILIVMISCSKPQVNDKILFDKGLAALDKGRVQEAREIFASADTLYPDSPYGPYGQALYYQKDGFVFEAIDSYEKLLAKYSSFAPAIMSYAELALKTGREDLSIGLAERYAQSVGETASSFWLKLNTLLTVGEFPKVASILENALAKFPDDPLILIAASKYYFHEGDMAKSDQFFQRAASKLDGKIDALQAAADYCYQRGLTDSAAVYLHTALETAPDDFFLKADAAELLIKMRYYFNVDQLMKEMSHVFDSSHIVIYLKAESFARQGKMKEARKAYETAMVRFPKVITVIRNMGLYKFKNFETMSSEAYFATAYTMAGERGFPPEELHSIVLDQVEGQIYSGKREKTTVTLAALVDSLPNDFRTLSDAAGVLLIFAPREDAAKLLKNLTQISQGNSNRLAVLGKIYEKADSLAQAENCYNESMKMDKANVGAILGMASIFKSQKNPQQALQFLKSMGGYILDIPDIADEAISLYNSVGDIKAARELAERQISLGTHCIERYRTALALEEGSGDKASADSLIKECLNKNSNDPEAYVFAGQYYFNNGMTEDTQREIDKALVLDDKSIDAQLLSASVDTLKGNLDKAESTYEKILQLDKDNGPAHAGLAWITTEKGGNYQIAANHAMYALSAEPENPMYYVVLGWAYYKAGRFNMARGNFEKALRYAPDNPVVNYYAGLGYWKDSKPDKAKESLQKALANGLAGKLRTSAETTLSKL